MANPYTVEVTHRGLPSSVLLKMSADDPATAADLAARQALEVLVDDDDLPDEDDTDALDMVLAEHEHDLDLLCDDSTCRVWEGHHDAAPSTRPLYRDDD